MKSSMEEHLLISELIALIYDAAAAPDLWPTFLERMADTLDLRAINFSLSKTESDGGLAVFPSAWGYDDSTQRAYEQYFGAIDPHRLRSLELTAGTVYTGGGIFPDAEFVRTEFFNDYYAPAGLRYEFGAVIHADASSASALVCHREAARGPAGETELALLRLLTPHLQRARALAAQLGTISSQARITSAVLDRLTVGLIFMDRNGVLVSANAAGERILEQQDGLRVRHGKLVAATAADTQALDAVIGGTDTAPSSSPALPTSIRLPRPSGLRDLEVMACPIDAESIVWSDGRAASFLVVSDGEAELRGVARRLRDLYDLSEAESKLVVALTNGVTVKEWAAQRDVSVETVRWQLKQAFSKTGTSRQPELMRLVLLGPALLP